MIKWQGWAHTRCTWHCMGELREVAGYKKVMNYQRRVEDEEFNKQHLTLEECEALNVRTASCTCDY